MPITPWNWLWSATTVALLIRARLRPRGRALLQPFAASAGVAAAVAWFGIAGPWHLLLFPVFPLLYVAAAQTRLPAARPEAPVTGAISVAYAPKRAARARREPRRRRAVKSSNPMTLSPVAWVPTAVAAIVLLWFGVDEFWVIAPVFPIAPMMAAGLWRRLDRLKVFAGADVRVLATLIALEVGVAAAAITAPESVPPVFDTAATSGRPVGSGGSPQVTTTSVPPVLTEGSGMLAVAVTGSVAREDGTTIVVPVEGAFVTLTPAVGAGRFALSDVDGRAAFQVAPGLYTVFVVPPGSRWSVMRGCRGLLERYPVAAGEVWTWQVPLVDDDAAALYGSVTRCNDLSVPTLSQGG